MAKVLFALLLLVGTLVFLLLRLIKRLATGRYVTPHNIDEGRRLVRFTDNPVEFTLNMAGQLGQIGALLVLIILVAWHYFR